MRAACAALGLLLGGCGTHVQVVRVPVPVACDVVAPARPLMPTDALPVDATLDAFVQAATAETERRDAYELELLAALEACTAPLAR